MEVKWRGLNDAEKSWEPAANLMTNLPAADTKCISLRSPPEGETSLEVDVPIPSLLEVSTSQLDDAITG